MRVMTVSLVSRSALTAVWDSPGEVRGWVSGYVSRCCPGLIDDIDVDDVIDGLQLRQLPEGWYSLTLASSESPLAGLQEVIRASDMGAGMVLMQLRIDGMYAPDRVDAMARLAEPRLAWLVLPPDVMELTAPVVRLVQMAEGVGWTRHAALRDSLGDVHEGWPLSREWLLGASVTPLVRIIRVVNRVHDRGSFMSLSQDDDAYGFLFE